MFVSATNNEMSVYNAITSVSDWAKTQQSLDTAVLSTESAPVGSRRLRKAVELPHAVYIIVGG